MAAPPSPVRALRSRLGRLRRRIRALFAMQGFARWLLAAVGALVLFFLADWLLDLPLGVRRFVRLGLLDRPEGLADLPRLVLLAVALWLTVWSTRARLGAAPVFAFVAGGAVGVLAWLAIRLFSPLGARLSDDDLALSVEHRFRRLNDRLAAALDFEEELAAPKRGESEAMMRVVLDEASREAEGLDFARAVSVKRALGWAGGCAVAVALAAGVAVAAPSTVQLWAQRSLLLEDRPWPRATTIVAVDLEADGQLVDHPPTRAYEVPVGRPLLVHALARGEVPDEVLLIDRVAGARPLPRRMFPVPDREGLFRVEVRDVRRPFEFVLQGGDDADDAPVYRVTITVPPRVLTLRARVVFPDYLERPEELVEGGNLAVPEGSAVTVAFETDVPVAEARVLLPDRVLLAEATGEEGRAFAFALVAVETLRYRIVLRTATGRESDPAADTYEVRVAPDRPPRLQWLHPVGPVETTPGGRVPLLFRATDDHAVRALELEVRLGDETVRRQPLVPYGGAEGQVAEGSIPALDGPYGREIVRAYVPLEIPSLTNASGQPPAAPARLAARVVARDSKGQAKEGTWAAIDVYGAVDVERTLASRRSVVRAELAAVLADQKERREQLAGLVGVVLEDAERDLLKSIQFAQAKIAQDTGDAVGGLTEIFNAWVYGRLGAENPTERVLSVLDRYHRRTYGVLPAAEGDAGASEAAAGASAGDPVFPYAVYDEIVQAWRDRVIFDTGLLDRMLVVLDEAVDAAARYAPAAYGAATAAAGGDGELAVALEAQDTLVASLQRALEAVRSWQSLNDVILQLRRVVEEQEALNERLLGEDDTR